MSYFPTPEPGGSGRTTVTSAGTRVQLVTTTTLCKRVDICALTNNTSYVVVGKSDVVAALATRKGIPLSAGDVYSIDVADLSKVYLDSLVNGEGVTYVYYV